MRKHLIVLCGPTGIGKTKISIEIARSLNCEIISADSRQLYKEMMIGTALPDPEELNLVQHYFVRSHSIHQNYNASMFEEEIITFLRSYFKDHTYILMVGGSGLYIDAVCHGIDELPAILPAIRSKWKQEYEKNGLPFLAEKVKSIDPDYFAIVDRNNPKRLLKALEVYEMTGKPYSSFLKRTSKKREFSIIKVGLNTGRNFLYQKINKRVDEMMQRGLLEEAKELFPHKHLTPLKTVGYKELFAYFEGLLSLEEAVEQIKNHSRSYARRQLTWFRKDKEITWFEPDEKDKIISFIHSKIKK
jgi:tRNA dimethylallyltransferase